MKCPKCASVCGEADKFCGNCGAQIERVVRRAHTWPRRLREDLKDAAQLVPRWLRLLTTIGAMVIVIGVGVAFLPPGALLTAAVAAESGAWAAFGIFLVGMVCTSPAMRVVTISWLLSIPAFVVCAQPAMLLAHFAPFLRFVLVAIPVGGIVALFLS